MVQPFRRIKLWVNNFSSINGWNAKKTNSSFRGWNRYFYGVVRSPLWLGYECCDWLKVDRTSDWFKKIQGLKVYNHLIDRILREILSKTGLLAFVSRKFWESVDERVCFRRILNGVNFVSYIRDWSISGHNKWVNFGRCCGIYLFVMLHRRRNWWRNRVIFHVQNIVRIMHHKY